MRNQRGVTPIISVVLLLMMTVAVAGLAWVWLQGMTENTMGATKNMTDTNIKQMLTMMDLADYGLECSGAGATATVQNIDLQVFNRGSTVVNVNSVLINGKAATIAPTTIKQINPGNIGTLNISNAASALSNLNASGTRTTDIMITAAEGYIKKTLTVDGSRCSQ